MAVDAESQVRIPAPRENIKLSLRPIPKRMFCRLIVRLRIMYYTYLNVNDTYYKPCPPNNLKYTGADKIA